MSRILAIVFSKDRAAQFDLLLRSMKKYCPNTFDVVVLYTHTNLNHENGYEALKAKHKSIYFQKERKGMFREDVLDIMERCKDTHECVGFFTDDSLFYTEFHLDGFELNRMLRIENIASLSTRLGNNIKWQNHWEPKQAVSLVKKEKVDKKFVKWRVCDAKLEEDYGRPISMDGNIHVLDQAYDLFSREDWNCIRTMDAVQPRGPHIFSCSFQGSVLVNVPVNLTYGGHADNFAKQVKHHQEDLATWFLMGNELRLENVVGPIESSHQEFDLITPRIRGMRESSPIVDFLYGGEPTDLYFKEIFPDE